MIETYLFLTTIIPFAGIGMIAGIAYFAFRNMGRGNLWWIPVIAILVGFTILGVYFEFVRAEVNETCKEICTEQNLTFEAISKGSCLCTNAYELIEYREVIE